MWRGRPRPRVLTGAAYAGEGARATLNPLP